MVVLVVMGVCGSGKTTIAKLLSSKIGCKFADADDWHPAANIGKMKQGIPLNDEDRQPWLISLNKLLLQWECVTSRQKHAQPFRNQVAPEEPEEVEAQRKGVETQRKTQRGAVTKERVAETQRKETETQEETAMEELENLADSKGETIAPCSAAQSRGENIGPPGSTGVHEILACSAAQSRGENIGPPGSTEVHGILACSALKRAYRDTLRVGVDPASCVFVVLNGSETLIRERMSGREHFMPPGLLRSQFQALELPSRREEGGNPVIMVDDISVPAAMIAEHILYELKLITSMSESMADS